VRSGNTVKRIIWSCVGLVLGALFIVGGIFGMTSDEITCGGEKMQEGDVCVSKTRGGTTTENTLDESKTNTKIGAGVGIGMGVLVIIIAAQNLRIGIRQKRQGGLAPAAAGVPPQHWQPQAPQRWAPQSNQPAPQYPQQYQQQQYQQQQPAPQYQQPGQQWPQPPAPNQPGPPNQPSWHNQN
jgi:hypothetical protein